VRVARVARLAAKDEIDAFVFAQGDEAIPNHLRARLAEFGIVHLHLVDAFGRIWVQVEGEPRCREGVIRVGMLLFVD